MNKMISATLMTIVAVPFLMAAPSAKKAQNGTIPAAPATSTMTKKAHKKHIKKASKPAVTAPATDAKK